jgi:folate-dependent phosphoribosylglycinamide formyltransferase PurN
VVREFHGRIINVHPGLLPEFGGAGMYGARVHQAVLASGSRTTGVTVHLVDDEFDHGPVVAQWRVKVNEDDTPETLAARVLEVEHVIYPRAVEMIAALTRQKLFADF